MKTKQCSQKWIPSIALAMLFMVTIACGTSSNMPAPTFDPNLLQTAVAGTYEASEIQTLTADIPVITQISNTPEFTNTPELTNTPAVTDIAAITPVVGILPGLQPADVKINLEERQFTCDLIFGPTDSDPYYKWECKSESTNYLMLVEIWSKSLFTVDLIQSSIMQFGTPDDELAANFLGFMATMPYDGADPQSARNWVEVTLPTIAISGDVRDATFGGVKFLLYGIPTARFLEFGEVSE
jgi:hypothetical protein